jgi:hypothetical protein
MRSSLRTLFALAVAGFAAVGCAQGEEGTAPATFIVSGAPDEVARFVADARIRYPTAEVAYEAGAGSAAFEVPDADTGVNLSREAAAARLGHSLQLRD